MHKRAIVKGIGQPLEIVTSQLEEPPAGYIRIRTAFAGVCHTDVSINETDILEIRHHYGEETFKGMVLGHEISGYVDEVGEGINLGEVGLCMGDPVMVLHGRGCRDCQTCRTGHPNACPDPRMITNLVGIGPNHSGGFQTHIDLPPDYLKRVPHGMTMDTAAMMSCSIGTAYAAVLKLQSAIQFGIETSNAARVAIIGCGGLGLWALRLIRIIFPQNVFLITIDIDKTKLETAKQHGSDQCFLWNADTSGEEICSTEAGGLVHGVIDFCSTEMTIKSSMGMLQKNGALVLVGVAGNSNSTIDWQDIVMRSITIHGVLNYSDQEMTDLAELVVKHNLTADNLEYMTLDEINEAFYRLKNGKIKGRAMIRF